MSSDFVVKEAVERFLSVLPKENGILTDEQWFWVLDLTDPRNANSIEASRTLQTKVLSRGDRLRDHLLEFYMIDLDRVQGVGYRRVPAEEQAQLASRQGVQRARNKLARALKRASFVNMDGLNDAQRRETTNARARLDTFAKGLRMRERRW